MDRKEAKAVLSVVAASSGYSCKGALAWNGGVEIVRMLQYQSSRWGSGTYVNFGIIPLALIPRSVPPGVAHWGYHGRAESLLEPFQDVFIRFALNEVSVSPDELEAALRWLFTWLDGVFANEPNIRRDVLDASSWLHSSGPVTLTFKAWARGETVAR